MTNFQWTLFTLCGVIIVVNANIWLAKRDAKMLSTPPQLETVTDDDYADKVDTLVGNMVASDDNVFTHDSEGC